MADTLDFKGVTCDENGGGDFNNIEKRRMDSGAKEKDDNFDGHDYDGDGDNNGNDDANVMIVMMMI